MTMMPSSEDILSVDQEGVPAFIQKHANAKTLSLLVKNLNHDLMTGNVAARRKAERALEHLGFVSIA